ncbi:hypothetical protein [uncultured Albimonas sp.]|uniref:hypothetical protein n=1 Tax=uncultured Albimonas sp. TaxID=1331701 RepID=UPI0030EE5391|tara:strand:- start:3516 stop:3770 length:255 start_codon:yes stop_codon:yes gene_type:complete
MTTHFRGYLRTVDPGPAEPSGLEARTRHFSSGAPTREASVGRPPPLKVYSRLQARSSGRQLRARHVAILAVVAAVIVYAKSYGV